jgi:anti-sigma regulatory factor (Ser/Thr protein kinase)
VELVEQVGGDPWEVSRVRHAVTTALDSWGVPVDHQDVVALLTSELVTNAIRHGRPPVRLRAALSDSAVTVSVDDRSAVPPVPVEDTAWDTSGGRGLHLVESLSDRWGVSANGVGKRVWFEVRLSA